MKKKNIILGLLSAFAMVSLASCNNASVLPGGDDNNNDTPVDDGNNNNGNQTKDDSFVLTVKMPDGTPATGVQVQWCNDSGTCFFPINVDENGMASSSKLSAPLDENGTYFAHILDCPKGYTYNPFEIIQTKANKVETMYLKKLNTYSEGTDGTINNPYNLNVGYSLVETTANQNVFYTFKPTKAGTYAIESIAATTEVDKKINAGFFKGNDLNKAVKETDKDERVNGKNFRYDLEYTAEDLANNVSYTIIIMVENKPKCEFTLMVAEK